MRKWCDRNPISSRDQMSSTADPSIHSPPNRGLPTHDSGTQNPSYRHSRNRYPPKKNPAYQTKDESAKAARLCVYCNGEDHRSAECGKFPSISQRRRILSDKKPCFNSRVRDIKHKTVAARRPVNDVAADITRLFVTGCLVTTR